MLNENQRHLLTNLLSQYFDNIQLTPFQMIDAQANVRESNIQFYVVYQSSRPTEDNVKNIYKQIGALPNASSILQTPIIIIAAKAHDYEFAVMAFNDYGSSRLNKNIKWRNFSDADGIEWLIQQLRIRRNHIELLPEKMWLIKKTIFLNSDVINDGEVIYFRKLSEDYKMNSPQNLTEKDRFDRVLNGTPEEEYPKDKLDEIIYQRFIDVYPNAKVKSETFLFSTDLANIRMKKEKLISSFKLYFVAISYDALGQPRANQVNQIDIDIELLYYPNIFGKNNILSINQVVLTDDNVISVINRQRNTYQTLSSINI